jgi:hypothetical protein
LRTWTPSRCTSSDWDTHDVGIRWLEGSRWIWNELDYRETRMTSLAAKEGMALKDTYLPHMMMMIPRNTIPSR